MSQIERAGGPHEPYAYSKIAARISDQIAAGTLRPGDRLPSVRRTAVQWGVSTPTAVQAYRVLEARRVIEARPRSGYFVLAPTRLPLSAARASRPDPTPAPVSTGDLVVSFLETVANPRHVPLGAALPDQTLIPTARLARVLGAVVRREPVRSALVSSPSGAEELRFEIARRSLAARAPVGADEVVVTTGCMEAVTLGLRAVTKPGDVVAVESPAYFGTLQVLEALGLRALHLPTDPHEGVDIAALDLAFRAGGVAAAVLTPSVQNPLGFVMTDARKRELGRVLDAHRIPVIEDDTYAELAYGSERPASLRAFVREAPVLSCGSFSKTLAPAWRVGWIVPGPYRDRLLRLKAATTVATPMPTQLAIAAFLGGGGYDQHLRKLKTALQANVERMISEVGRVFPAETRISQPVGAFLLWVELPAKVDAVELAQRTLRRRVSVAPGPVFSATGEHRSCMRLNAGLLWSDRIADAVGVIAEEAASLMRSAS